MSRSGTLAALAAVVVLVSRVPAPSAGHDEKEARPSLHKADGIKWQDGPPSLPPGAKITVLEGDPSKAGPFVFRVKVPDGYRIPPHTHPKPERVTVISGTFNLGMGGRFDATKTEALLAGGYGTWPAGMKHFVWVKGETVVQFHGDGPWVIEYLDPADDPRNQKK
jgi:quercetin dioxygenase-like cupin family protein